MVYSIQFKRSVAKDLRKLPKETQRLLLDVIDQELGRDPHQGEQLKGQFKGLRRLRQGRYRIIYQIIELEVVVLAVKIGHRKDVYAGM